jgi:hypothetical protein
MSRVFIQHETIGSLVNQTLKNRIIRCTPSLLIVSRTQCEFKGIATVYNKDLVDKYKSLQFMRCYETFPKQDPVLDLVATFTPTYKNNQEVDTGYKILDISYLDYPFEYYRKDLSRQEWLRPIKEELDHVAKTFGYHLPLDGYMCDMNEFMFFNTRE